MHVNGESQVYHHYGWYATCHLQRSVLHPLDASAVAVQSLEELCHAVHTVCHSALPLPDWWYAPTVVATACQQAASHLHGPAMNYSCHRLVQLPVL